MPFLITASTGAKSDARRDSYRAIQPRRGRVTADPVNPPFRSAKSAAPSRVLRFIHAMFSFSIPVGGDTVMGAMKWINASRMNTRRRRMEMEFTQVLIAAPRVQDGKPLSRTRPNGENSCQ